MSLKLHCQVTYVLVALFRLLTVQGELLIALRNATVRDVYGLSEGFSQPLDISFVLLACLFRLGLTLHNFGTEFLNLALFLSDCFLSLRERNLQFVHIGFVLI